MLFLSVIIPIYNVEPYLRQCVDSVLNQKLDNYELILVDDGSPDACPKICDDYAERFPNVHVIHQKNSGLSVARNAGLHAAAGEYIVFMDSDDWWNPEVRVSNMLDEVRQNPDVDVFLFSGLDYVEGEGYFERSDSIRRLGRKRFDAAAYYETMLAMGNLQVHAATKFLKKSFLLNDQIWFSVGLKGEDNDWMIRLLRANPNIMILPEPLYIYRSGRAGSISNTIGKKNVSDLLQIVSDSIKHYSAPGTDQALMKHEYCFCAYLWFCALGLSDSLTEIEKKEISGLFQKTSAVCQYSNSRKTRLAYILYRTAGLSLTRQILHGYIRQKNKLTLNRRRADTE